jgi:hypothetical protein
MIVIIATNQCSSTLLKDRKRPMRIDTQREARSEKTETMDTLTRSHVIMTAN